MNARSDQPTLLGRRHLLQMMLGAAGLLSLGGCQRGLDSPQVLAPSGLLPRLWTGELPSPWRLRTADSAMQWRQEDRSGVDLLAVADGWLDSLATVPLQSIAAEPLVSQLDQQARRFLAGLGPLGEMLLPVGVSPWVMLLRQDVSPVEAARKDGWDVLLNPALRGHVVLPNSPRFVIDLADRLPGAEASLPALRRQVLTLDDRQGANWLLKGDARVVVLPLQRCLPLLRRDPRLMAVLPAQGAPLHWTLLARPEATREPLPQSWVRKAWTPSLRGRLLEQGWRAPLSEQVLARDRAVLPERWRSLVLPPERIWSRCWSFNPLSSEQRDDLRQRWQASTP